MHPFDPLGLLPTGGTPAIGYTHSLLRIPHSLEHDEQRDLSRQRKKLHILCKAAKTTAKQTMATTISCQFILYEELCYMKCQPRYNPGDTCII